MFWYSIQEERELEDTFKGATALFFQGAGADQNPLPRRKVSLAKQYGKELAAAVAQVLNEEMRELEQGLTTVYTDVEIALDDPPDKEELIKIRDHAAGWQRTWAEKMLLRMDSGSSFVKNYPFPAQFWRIGQQHIFSFGGELLVGYANNLKRIFGEDLFVMGYSNDVMAYIPTEKVLLEGGYEGETSQWVYGLPARWRRRSETASRLHEHLLLRHLQNTMHPLNLS